MSMYDAGDRCISRANLFLDSRYRAEASDVIVKKNGDKTVVNRRKKNEKFRKVTPRRRHGLRASKWNEAGVPFAREDVSFPK